ncbi:xanthine dehydrogenase accessory factor [Desulfonatronum thiosulfatophilum]|uniref:Xanthine dehydrogenase accessory factor n=1 Tax=Desulfonatronum thiosulfatophilum TaxID=617002 RepID=A0A1G6DW30_9BACT|nr:XdhC/CoxI family protein [Desulfonatronum thiosulfatophilum]SDB49379.1 xanthine dehydrogenase accessory factor [Desulfonatronum thiosulfatophilum]
MNQLSNEILALLESGEPSALATIVSLSGSAPRTAGTCMAVRGNGSIMGTIGGGRLEAEVIQAGIEALRTGKAFLRRFELTGKDVRDMDMICGGVLDVLVEPVCVDERTIGLLRTLDRLRAEGRQLLLATLLQNDRKEQDEGYVPQRLLVELTPSGPVFHPREPENAAAFIPLLEAARTLKNTVLFDMENVRLVVEPVLNPETVHLFGAGHVSMEVAALAHRMGFRVEVYDDRPEFANRQRFPNARAVHVPESLATALDSRRITDNCYIVIITRGHSHDMDILAQALPARAGYIGMIGSRRKRDAIYAALRRQGFNQSQLDAVHCPIGLDIHAETPAEIALSIVGELVKVRAERSTAGKRLEQAEAPFRIDEGGRKEP